MCRRQLVQGYLLLFLFKAFAAAQKVNWLPFKTVILRNGINRISCMLEYLFMISSISSSECTWLPCVTTSSIVSWSEKRGPTSSGITVRFRRLYENDPLLFDDEVLKAESLSHPRCLRALVQLCRRQHFHLVLVVPASFMEKLRCNFRKVVKRDAVKFARSE